jgi:tetratricopeptide (TPR) repeat protein
MTTSSNLSISSTIAVAVALSLGGCADTTVATAPTSHEVAAAQPSAAVAPPTATTSPTDFIANQPPALQPFFQQLYQEGERNAVLNFDRLAVAALANHEYDIARKALDQAIQRIDAFRASGTDLKYAKSKFGDEANKDFKGEPYERGMTFYYRGLVYLHDGDFSNAAASFARVNVEDSVAEGETYRGDYASMKFLQAWALRCQGEPTTSASLYSDATGLLPALSGLDFQSPTLIIIETGAGPQKVGTGKWHEKLTFVDPGADDVAPVTALAGSQVPSPVLAESLYYQASTRGGRPVEYILSGKASFKSGAQTASNVAAGVAVAATESATLNSMTGNYNAALNSSYLGLASSLFSLGSQIAANAAQPAADTRTWESIPGSIWVETLTVASTDKRLEALTVAQAGPRQAADLQGAFGACSARWYRLAPLVAPQSDPHEKIDDTKEAKARLSSFQASLPSLF